MALDVIKALNWRYATKQFDPTAKLSDQQLEVLKEAFNLTATSYGLQPLKLVIVSEQAVKDKLVPLSMDQKQVQEASHVLVFCIESNLNADFIEAYFNNVQRLRNTPDAILDPFKNYLKDEFATKKEAEIKAWMTKQAYLAMGNLLTVCALEGIDACPMEGFTPAQYNSLLGLDKLGLESVLVMPVGFRAKDDMFARLKKVRRGSSQVVIEL